MIEEIYKVENLDLTFHKNSQGWLQSQCMFNNNYGISCITNLNDTPVKIPRGDWDNKTFELAIIRVFENGDTRIVYKHPDFINNNEYRINGVFSYLDESELKSLIDQVQSLPDIFQGNNFL